MTQQDFKRMRYLINRLPGARLKIMRAKSRATKVTQTLSDMPHGTDVSSPVENGVMAIDEAEEYFREIKAELKRMERELIPLIDKLENEKERRVLILRYIKGYSVRKIGFVASYSEQRIYQLLKDGEKNIVKMSQN